MTRVEACSSGGTPLAAVNGVQGEAQAKPLENRGICAVMLHGFLGSPAHFAPLAALAEACGVQTHTISLPGHGGSLRQFLRTGRRAWEAHGASELTALRAQHELCARGGTIMEWAVLAETGGDAKRRQGAAPVEKSGYTRWHARACRQKPANRGSRAVKEKRRKASRGYGCMRHVKGGRSAHSLFLVRRFHGEACGRFTGGPPSPMGCTAEDIPLTFGIHIEQ